MSLVLLFLSFVLSKPAYYSMRDKPASTMLPVSKCTKSLIPTSQAKNIETAKYATPVLPTVLPTMNSLPVSTAKNTATPDYGKSIPTMSSLMPTSTSTAKNIATPDYGQKVVPTSIPSSSTALPATTSVSTSCSTAKPLQTDTAMALDKNTALALNTTNQTNVNGNSADTNLYLDNLNTKGLGANSVSSAQRLISGLFLILLAHD